MPLPYVVRPSRGFAIIDDRGWGVCGECGYIYWSSSLGWSPPSRIMILAMRAFPLVFFKSNPRSHLPCESHPFKSQVQHLSPSSSSSPKVLAVGNGRWEISHFGERRNPITITITIAIGIGDCESILSSVLNLCSIDHVSFIFTNLTSFRNVCSRQFWKLPLPSLSDF
jgi:hypothetical protein